MKVWVLGNLQQAKIEFEEGRQEKKMGRGRSRAKTTDRDFKWEIIFLIHFNNV